MSKKEITIIVSIILSMYLGFAFMAAEMNPFKWHFIGRVAYVLFTVIVLAVTFIDGDGDRIKRF